jgi:hypothetical protein
VDDTEVLNAIVSQVYGPVPEVRFGEGRTISMDRVWIEFECDCKEGSHMQVLSEWL